MMNSIQHETELPVAEILHRVANCFQLLTSTVHLRLKQTSDPVARDELAWMLELIRTVSLLQRHLTSHREQNFEDYLQELVKYWQPHSGQYASRPKRNPLSWDPTSHQRLL